MPSRHEVAASRAPLAILLIKELRELFAGRALWIMVLLLCPVVGYGFVQAVGLYGEASRSAARFPELARGLSPLDGVLVPTFGAFYVAVTLFFPFVAIRLVGAEKRSGGLKLLLQLPYRTTMLVGAKLAAAMTGWMMALIPGLSALALWSILGGHLSGAETATLLLGHLLYGLLIAAVGLFAAAVTDASATAAIAALAFTLGAWVLDFAATGQGEWLRRLAALSPTAALKTFEGGLFALPVVLGLLIGAGAFGALATVWLPTGSTLRAKLARSGGILMLVIGLALLSTRAALYADVAEDRRDSFAVGDEIALGRLDHLLTITVYLAPEDPRFVDLDRTLLSKLRRLVPDLIVRQGDVARGLFAAAADDRYGSVTYRYGDRQDESRSTSPEEILHLIYRLAGIVPIPSATPDYPGYPLVATMQAAALWFYLVLPIMFTIAWWWVRRPASALRLPKGETR